MTTRRPMRAVDPTAVDPALALLEFLPQRVRHGYARMGDLLDEHGVARGGTPTGVLFLTIEADQVIPLPDGGECDSPAC